MKISQSEQLEISAFQTKKAALVIRSINHKLRQQMLKLIDENGRMTVTMIYKKLQVEQSVASQHLAVLRHAGVVNTEREERFIFYSINYKRLKELNLFAEALR